MTKIAFLKTFIKDKKVGAVTPTSIFVVRKACSHIDFSKDITIVEYGPGNGVFTRELLKKISGGSRIIAIETNESFVEHLNQLDDDRLIVCNDEAQNLSKILKNINIDSVDYVISGIPFTFLPPEVRKNIVQSTYDALHTGGMFIVYQYSLLMKRHLEKKFGKIKIQFLPFNIPSMFLMLARKKS